MTARIIWIGKNSQMAVTPRSALSAGATAAARPSLLPDDGRAAPSSLPPRVLLPARGNLARSSMDRAPSFDATAERWIVPPTTIMVDAGGAADLRHVKTKHTQTARTRRRARRSPLARYLLEVAEFCVVVIGLGASLVLALLLWAVTA
jgi:hypothetical protein